jgi:hypothetical protein
MIQRSHEPAPAAVAVAPRVWLLFALQLPATPSNARVKTWRRLQRMGAVALRGSLYVLPSSAQGLENFQWLTAEVEALNGQASVFEATSPNGLEDGQLVEQFQKARAADFKAIEKDLRKAQTTAKRKGPRIDASKMLRLLEDRLAAITAIDFFAAPGRDSAVEALQVLATMLRPAPVAVERQTTPGVDVNEYRHRLWVTRPRPGVDRMASAWLISRFIDRQAKFAFSPDPAEFADGVPFDMYGTGFGHRGDRCTFEVLQSHFAIGDAAARRIGEIVHDLDLDDDRFRLAQTPGVRAMVDGLQKAFVNDDDLLRQGIVLFDAVYRGLQEAAPASRGKTLRLRNSGGSK